MVGMRGRGFKRQIIINSAGKLVQNPLCNNVKVSDVRQKSIFYQKQHVEVFDEHIYAACYYKVRLISKRPIEI